MKPVIRSLRYSANFMSCSAILRNKKVLMHYRDGDDLTTILQV